MPIPARLQSGLPPEAVGGAAPGGFAGGNASDVTTQRLVEFEDIEVGAGRQLCTAPAQRGGSRTRGRPGCLQAPRSTRLPANVWGELWQRIRCETGCATARPAPTLGCACGPLPLAAQELQQQNARLLVVNRQLSQEAEATRAEAEAAIRAEYDAGLQEVGWVGREAQSTRSQGPCCLLARCPARLAAYPLALTAAEGRQSCLVSCFLAECSALLAVSTPRPPRAAVQAA